MNNSPNQQGANQATNKPRGLIAGAIGLLIELVIWLCAALMFNILVELVGIFFKYWSIPGRHIQRP